MLILSSLMALYVSSGWMYTCIYLLPAMLVFFAEHNGEPIRLKARCIPDYLSIIMFLAVFSRPFALGEYWFIYGAMIVIISIFNIVVIGAVVYRKWKKYLLAE